MKKIMVNGVIDMKPPIEEPKVACARCLTMDPVLIKTKKVAFSAADPVDLSKEPGSPITPEETIAPSSMPLTTEKVAQVCNCCSDAALCETAGEVPEKPDSPAAPMETVIPTPVPSTIDVLAPVCDHNSHAGLREIPGDVPKKLDNPTAPKETVATDSAPSTTEKITPPTKKIDRLLTPESFKTAFVMLKISAIIVSWAGCFLLALHLCSQFVVAISSIINSTGIAVCGIMTLRNLDTCRNITAMSPAGAMLPGFNQIIEEIASENAALPHQLLIGQSGLKNLIFTPSAIDITQKYVVIYY